MARRLATKTAKKSIACPQCGTRYSVPDNARGMVQCRNCGARFSASYDRGSTDTKTAVRALVIGAVVIVFLGVLIVGFGSKKAPGGKRPEDTTSSRTSSGSTYDLNKPRENAGRSSSTSGEPIQRLSDQPPIVAKKFLRAMVDQDRDKLEEMFSFESYFGFVAEKYKWDDSRRYESQTPEAQAEMRQAQIDHLLHEETRGWIERSLLPALEAGTAERVGTGLDLDAAWYEWSIADGNGKPVLNVRLSLGLRGSLDTVDNQREEAWIVKMVQTLWHQTAIGVSKPDKRAVDMGEGRVWKEEKIAEKENPSGFAEADPFTITPPASVPAELASKIEGLIRTAVDPQATVESNRARDELEKIGAPALPFLLNTLVGKDHENDEADIKASVVVTQVLLRITGKSFGYGPPAAADPFGGEIAGATPEQRKTAVRGWFGWWKARGRSFTGKEIPEEDKEVYDPKRPWRKRPKGDDKDEN